MPLQFLRRHLLQPLEIGQQRRIFVVDPLLAATRQRAAGSISPAANEPNRPPSEPASTAKATIDTPPPESHPSLAANQMIEARLLVGPDVKLKGAEILDCDTLVVEGRVEATMDSRVIRIAENGAFIGKVSIDVAETHGVFEGELTARSQLIVHSTGRVNGKIRYGKLVVDEGGVVCGEINTLSEHETPRARRMIDVNPRPARRYQRLPGFRQFGEQRHRALDHLSVAARKRRNEAHTWQ